MKYAKIRQAFTEFFENQQHTRVESSPLVPLNDPTLMFNNAGMNQFKDVFLGTEQRDYNRAVTIQKCLRAGGKHNDLENVGFTARHHTFFEMMGNFSFGDYFKKQAITFAWEFLTETLAIPKDRLFVTVFTTDDEAAEIWEKHIGVPKEKIFRFGEKDNFWRMGQTGPCGPCSEIFYDHRPDEPPVPIDQDEDRYVEIWNLVFMQFFEDENGQQTPLPKPSVDTGAGIERIAAALQGFADNYQGDIFQPLIKKVCDVSGLKNDWNLLSKDPATIGAVKVVADHARSAAFLISEGVLPSNEGKGYVLRRIMRRAIRYARKLTQEKSLYPLVCEEVIRTMSPYYPELNEKSDFIIKAVRDEETRFLKTLDHGSDILLKKIEELKAKGQSRIDGLTAFTMYGTYGFPLDLTEVIAKEHGLSIDSDGFEKQLKDDRDKARQSRKSFNITSDEKHLGEWTQALKSSTGATEFVGYSTIAGAATIIGLSNGENDSKQLSDAGWVAFDTTPFYPEGGGQVADKGLILSETGDTVLARVTACKKINDLVLHFAEPNDGQTLSQGRKVKLTVNSMERQATANNHSATHLLNAALKEILGDHVNQAGSLVNEQKLRFDFSHGQPLTPQNILEIEERVNQQIAQASPVNEVVMDQKQAIAAGAVAMFGEKYDDQVRVISMGNNTEGKSFSMELCGGTHVQNTSQIGVFKILSETGVAAGVRRIEAITGGVASRYLGDLANENLIARKALNIKAPKPGSQNQKLDLLERLQEQQNKIKELEQQLKTQASQSVSVDDLLTQAKDIVVNGQKGKALFARVDVSDRQVLSEVADKIRDKQNDVAIALIGESTEGPRPLIVAVSKSLKSLHAGKLTKEICQIMDGKGGGRPDFAQGSVASLDKLNAAKDKFYELIG